MATNDTAKELTAEEKTEAVKSKTAKPKKPQLSIFSADELAEMNTRFGVAPEMVKAALRDSKIAECSITEAEKIIKDFNNREV